MGRSKVLTPGVNFINVFTYKFFVQTSFQQLFLVIFCFGKILFNVDEIDGWYVKILHELSVYACVKAARRTLMKLTGLIQLVKANSV